MFWYWKRPLFSAGLIILLFCLPVELFARPGQASLRSRGTGGVFGQTYDIFTTQPYLLGLAGQGGKGAGKGEATVGEVAQGAVPGSGPLNYSSSHTLAKDNIFSNINDLNDNGAFLAGSTFKAFGLHWGVSAEVAIQKQAQGINNLGLGAMNQFAGVSTVDTTPGNTNLGTVTFTGQSGSASQTLADYYDPSSTGTAVESALLEGDGEYYDTTFDINARLVAVLPISKNFHIGAALERYTNGTDFAGNAVNSSDTNGSGSLLVEHRTLTGTEVVDYRYDQTADVNDDRTEAVNSFHLFIMNRSMGPFDFAAFGVETQLIQSSRKTTAERKLTVVDTDRTTTYTETISDNYDDTGLIFLPSFTGWARFWGWEWQTDLTVGFGSLPSDTAGTSTTAGESSEELTGNSIYADGTDIDDRVKMQLDSSSFLYGRLGLTGRKQIKALRFGTGLAVSYLSTEEILKTTTNNSTTLTQNDGNGVTDAADFSRSLTSSLVQNITDKTETLTVEIPIGIEYNVTANFAVRAGLIHSIQHTIQTDDVETVSASDEISRTEFEDGTVSEQFSGTNSSDTTRAERTVSSTTIQSNTFAVGLGYNLDSVVVFDLLVNATNTESPTTGGATLSAASIEYSATFLY